MAIGTSGGSAASRFRPRGTAPAANVGLGRRDLLAEDEPAVEEPTAGATEGDSVSVTTETKLREFVRRGQSAQTAVNTLGAGPNPQPETTEPATTTPESASSYTSTAQSPSTVETTSARRRGRPSANTQSAAPQPSHQGTDGGALSVAGARARMREIEAELKAQRAALQSEIVALQRAHDSRGKVLRAEYHELSDVVLGE